MTNKNLWTKLFAFSYFNRLKQKTKEASNKVMKIVFPLVVVISLLSVAVVTVKRDGLVDYVRSIVNDPAFYSLEFDEQYNIITFIQIALEHHLRISLLQEQEKEDIEQLGLIENKMDEMDAINEIEEEDLEERISKRIFSL